VQKRKIFMPRIQCGAFAVLFFALSIPIGFAQTGIITTYVGPRLPVNGAMATTQSIGRVTSTVSDGAGGFYLSVTDQNRVYRVAADGTLSFVAGSSTSNGFSGDGGPAVLAQLNNPYGLAVDTVGNLYIADAGSDRIRKVTPAGMISTVAGNGTQGFSGDGGPATSAQLFNPFGIAVDTAGNLYFADMNNNRIRKVTTEGIISTVAGNGTYGFDGDGGPATSAELGFPFGVAVDTAGNLYVADKGNNCIRAVTPAGVIGTVAGNGNQGFSGDGGLATSAQLNEPYSVAVDTTGNLYIADYYNQRIREVTPAGMIRTVAGNGSNGDGGPATSAWLYYPSGVAVDAAGNLYIANGSIRKVTPDGMIGTVAGGGTNGLGDGGPATSAQLSANSVAVDTAGNLYIADNGNYRIHKVTPAGVISTVAGMGFEVSAEMEVSEMAASLLQLSWVMPPALRSIVRAISISPTLFTIAFARSRLRG
jgi:trimeric autotransporter adhesin